MRGLSAYYRSMCSETRMWANAKHDVRPVEYRWPLCSTPQSLMADTHYWSNAVKTRNPLKYGEFLVGKKKEAEEITGQKYSDLPYSIGGHNKRI